MIDYVSLEDAKMKDSRSFFSIYWGILSLRHSIINLFSFIKKFNITISYTPFQIKIIKFIFTLLLNLFFNAFILTQDYFKNKFYYFNEKYNILHNDKVNILYNEKMNYAMRHCFPRIFLALIVSRFFIQ